MRWILFYHCRYMAIDEFRERTLILRFILVPYLQALPITHTQDRNKGTKCINHFYIRHGRNPNRRYVSDTKYMKPLYISDSLEFLDTKTTIPPLYLFL